MPPCWATVPAPSTPIWPTRPSAQLIDEGLLDKDYYAAVDDYNKAMLNGIVKIASKMGISTIQSYQSSQIFEAVGICQGGHRQVLHRHGQPCGRHRSGGHSGGCGSCTTTPAFDPLGLDINMRAGRRRCSQVPQRQGRAPVQPRRPSICSRRPACTGDYKAFKEFTRTVDNMGAEGVHLRSLLDFSYDPDGGIPFEEVEPRRAPSSSGSRAAAMSYGALSSEAHETIAIALNRLGGRSQHRRGRRARGALPARESNSADQAGGLGPLRCDQQVSGLRRGDPDQDGTGRKARRGRQPARRQGLPLDRQDPPHHHRRGPDLSPAPPRHLLHRGSGRS